MTEAGGNGKCTINSHLHFDQMFSLSINNRNVDIVYSSKNALKAVVSLACLVIRSRNKEAINSTRNRVYSLKVCHLLLYRRSSILQDVYSLIVSELI